MSSDPQPGFIRLRHCPACASGAVDEVYRAPYDAGPVRGYLERFYVSGSAVDFAVLAGSEYVVDRCRTCGTAYQRHIPDERLSRLLYEEWIDPAGSRDRHRQRPLAERLVEGREIAALIEHLGRPAGTLEVLDFGGGWGGWALHARALGCRTALAELSPSRIAYARGEGTETVDLDTLGDRRFDLINCEQVFEHLGDPAGILARLVRCTKPGGLLRINVPNGHDISRRLARMDWHAEKGTRNSLNLLSPLEHLVAFTPLGLRRLGSAAGLVRERIPLIRQWRCTLDPSSPTRLLRSLAKPIYYNGDGTTHLFFRRPAGAPDART